MGQVWYRQPACSTGTSTTCPNLLVPLRQVVLVPVACPNETGLVQAPPFQSRSWTKFRVFPYQKPKGSYSNFGNSTSKIVIKLVKNLEIRTGFPSSFVLVSKTCHDALSTKNRDKVSVSVFVTVVTV